MEDNNGTNYNTEQIDYAQDDSTFTGLSAEVLKGMLSEYRERMTNAGTALYKLVGGQTYNSEIWEATYNFAIQWLGRGGWLNGFVIDNKKLYSENPKNYNKFSPSEKQKYNDSKDCYLFMADLAPYTNEAAALIVRSNYSLSSKLIVAHDGLLSERFNQTMYKKIDVDMAALREQLMQPFNSIRSDRADAVIDDKERLGPAKYKQYMQEARLYDYHENIGQSPFYGNLIYKSGSIYMKSGIVNMMGILDKYTAEIAKTAEHESRFKADVSESETLIESINKAKNQCTVEGCKETYEALLGMMIAFNELAVKGEKYYSKFKEGNPEAPFCYMKAVPGISGGWTYMTPQTTDPWAGGTKYKEDYTNAKAALNKHLEDYKKWKIE